MAVLSAPVPLAAQHLSHGFDCGEPVLDDWLRHRALRNEGRFSRTFVVCDGDRIAAYVCIAAGAVERSGMPGRLRRNAPDVVPVSVIGRLAVSRSYGGQGLGRALLQDALRRIAAASTSIGIAAVLIQAKSPAARRFYMQCAEFIEFPADSRMLFLPIETVIHALQPQPAGSSRELSP